MITPRLESLQQQPQADADGARQLVHKVKQSYRFQLELGAGNRVVRFFTRLPPAREPDGTYRFSARPREFAQLVTHGDLSVIVLLPRSAQGYDTPPL
jgi:hypothetical protein